MIGIHSYFKDRVERLGKRRNENDDEELAYAYRDNSLNFEIIKELTKQLIKDISNNTH